MSDDLVITLTFPTGHYAANGDGRKPLAEWPPAPERVAAALLAVTGEVDATITELYSLPAPTLVLPHHGSPRSNELPQWVPRAQSEAKRYEKYFSKIDRYTHRSAVAVDGEVHIVWAGAGHLAAALNTAAQRLSYLGRPTSAVLARAWPSNTLPQGQEIWVPSPSGEEQVSTCSPEVLAQRVANHELDLISGGQAPSLPLQRHWTTYARRAPVVEHAPGSFASVRDLLEDACWMGFDTWLPDTLAGQALRLIDDGWAVPICAQGNLLGVLAQHGQTIEVPTSRSRATARPGARMPFEARNTLRDLVASSTWWTTSAPLRRRGGLVEGLAEAGWPVAEAGYHVEPLSPAGIWPGAHPDETHLTILFSEPVRGPIMLDGQLLHPTRPRKEDVS